jgi:Icc-related predicted phosphoesterase
MKILVVSDLHGDLGAAWRAIKQYEPDGLLSCGDWGDPEELSEADLRKFTDRLPALTTYGNHDALDLLRGWRNSDGSHVLADQGDVRDFLGLRIGAIGGIWAKSHRMPHYVTDDDVAQAAQRLAGEGPVDVLLTHGCPVGMADFTPSGRHGGQRCFLDAFKTVNPQIHLCGHLHLAQERVLKDGRKVINAGATPEGTVVIIERAAGGLNARLEHFDAKRGVDV